MPLAKLAAIATALSAATWLSLVDRAEAGEWGCEVAPLRLVLQSFLARCASLPSANVSPDFGVATPRVLLADVSRGRNSQTGP